MIAFKLTLRKGSKIYYSFSAAGLSGIIVIDTETSKISFSEIEGFLKTDEKEKEQMLYIAKKKIISMNFPESCIYATH